jgi:3',5'-cyclic AMP phosphodiesterase CpdA
MYNDVQGVTFTEKRPWSLFVVEELKLVVAGLNSTMAESHEKDAHYGHLGDVQAEWFAEELKSFREQGWLRIGAVHHNVVRGATDDNENLRDVDDLRNWLGPFLNCVLHGHTHEAKTGWLTTELRFSRRGARRSITNFGRLRFPTSIS